MAGPTDGVKTSPAKTPPNDLLEGDDKVAEGADSKQVDEGGAEGNPAPAPAEDAAPVEEPAPTTTVQPVTNVEESADESTPSEEEAAEDPGPYTFGAWQRFHLILGGQYNFGTTIAPEQEPFSTAAQNYNGGGFHAQVTASAFGLNPTRDLPYGRFDLRLGLDFKQNFLTSPNEPGLPRTGVNATSIGGLVEANVFIHRHFGIGANGTVGYVGLSSDEVDVGLPFTAHLDFDGGLNLGGQLYLHFWDGNIRLGGGVDAMMTQFDLDTGPGNPALRMGTSPMWSIFGGLDVLGIVRSAQGH